MQSFKVGQAPWETQEPQSFAVGSAPWEQKEEEPETDIGYIRRVGQAYGTAGKEITSAVTEGAQKLSKSNSTLKDRGTMLRTGLRTAGAVAGAALAPIFEAPGIKQASEFIAKKAVDTPLLSEIIKDGVALAERNPTAARDVRNIFDIVTLGTGKAIEKPLANEIKAIGSDVSQGVRSALSPSEEATQKKVIELFQKSIKPTAKKTTGQADKYNSDVLSALRTIKSNADNLNIEDASGELVAGRTPQTINELAQSLEQTKTVVFNQYDALAKQAGTAGATIDPKPIADEVLKVAQNRALQLTNPEIIKYAENWSTRLRGMENLDAETTQEVIKLMNANLQAFYRNPTYDAASKVAIDAGIANNFRVALDKAIEESTGSQYQALKNEYAALKSIENDVVRASMRESRKNAKGLLDYSDMFTSGQMLTGILSLNPAMFTKGAIERGFKEYIRTLNDPNRAVSNMFDMLNLETREAFSPVSATVRSLQKPSLGMSIKDITQDPQDLQRFQSMYNNTKNTTNNIRYIEPTVPQDSKSASTQSTAGVSAETAKNIHSEDIDLMKKYIDSVRIQSDMSLADEKMAYKLMERFNIDPDMDANKIATAFEDILQGKKKVKGTNNTGRPFNDEK